MAMADGLMAMADGRWPMADGRWADGPMTMLMMGVAGDGQKADYAGAYDLFPTMGRRVRRAAVAPEPALSRHRHPGCAP